MFSIDQKPFYFRVWVPVVLGFLVDSPVFSQEEIIVTAVGRDADTFVTPYTTAIYSSDDIQLAQQSRSLPEIFLNDPSVLVQKTSNGQGSPYFRGFTGFRTLLLIDGIRLNNSTFREGPNQYWNTLDHFTIEQLEVVKGPSSVLYGSDSIGGTVNVRTFLAEDSLAPGKDWSLRSLSRYAHADTSWVERLEGSARLRDDLIVSGGITSKNYGDVEAGGNTGNQPRTGYDELDADLRVDYRIDDQQRLVFAHQQVDQDDAWRTHRTREAVSWRGTSIGSDVARVFDHDRSLTYLQYIAQNPVDGIDAIRVSLSQQRQEEVRDRIRSNLRTEFQGTDVSTLGLSLQAQSDTEFGYFVYGIEHYSDDVDSFFRSFNPDGSFREERLQGSVADDATSDQFGLYVQDEIPVLDSRGSIIAGLRYTRSEVKANKVLDIFTGNQTSASGDWDKLAGSLRFSYEVNSNMRLFAGISQGFRAPNLSDLTRLDNARTNEIETPSPNLDSEDFVAYEVGAKYRDENFYLESSLFYTDIKSQIIRFPTGVVIDGDDEVQKANIGNGYIRGVELNGHYNFNINWALFAGFTWTEGEVSTYPTSDQIIVNEPIDRMLPTNGIVGVRWNSNFATGLNSWVEFQARVVDGQYDLSTRDRGDTSRIAPGGTPGYTLLNVRGGSQISESLRITLALENLFDKDFRIHGSGQNEPGRNVIVSLDIGF